MDNQHRKIKGYRELDQEEIDLMNEIKQKGIELGELVDKVEVQIMNSPGSGMEGNAESMKWKALGRTELQKGLMMLTRAVAKPEFF